jgi:hypothetical protein
MPYKDHEKEKAARRARRQANPEKYRAKARAYAKTHRQALTAAGKKWLAKNPDKKANYTKRKGEP